MSIYSSNIELCRRPSGNIDALSNANIPPLLKKIYAQRGIKNISELEYDIYNLLTYQQLAGIEKAVNILVNALINKQKLIVVGDFDVDGATSVALTVLALQQFGASTVNFLIPNRFKDGYGLSPTIVKQAITLGAQLILTVDNGISSHIGVSLARKNGIQVLITDHHLPGNTLPNANAIVNPNLPDSNFVSKALAGVGVAFYLMLALRAKLKEQGWFIKHRKKSPKLAMLLDLVALGTVVDMVPLDFNNRILIHQGLIRIRAGHCRPGINALVEVSNCNITKLCTKDLCFALGPRLNAAGRLNDMSIGVALLLTDDISKARILANKLNSFNRIRREIEQNMEIEALTLCHKIICTKNKMPFSMVIYRTKWHQGIIGILASRIKEYFYRPVIAFAPAGKEVLKGSGRSVAGLNMYNLLEQLNIIHPDLLLNFGGHAMAVGITLKKSKFKYFCQYFSELINKYMDPILLKSIIWSDGELIGQEFSINTAEMLNDAGPWGHGFPDPLFDGHFYILYQQLVKKKHLKLILKPLMGGPILNGIAFNVDTNLWSNSKICTIRAAYKLSINEFRGNRSFQLLIKHIWLM